MSFTATGNSIPKTAWWPQHVGFWRAADCIPLIPTSVLPPWLAKPKPVAMDSSHLKGRETCCSPFDILAEVCGRWFAWLFFFLHCSTLWSWWRESCELAASFSSSQKRSEKPEVALKNKQPTTTKQTTKHTNHTTYLQPTLHRNHKLHSVLSRNEDPLYSLTCKLKYRMCALPLWSLLGCGSVVARRVLALTACAVNSIGLPGILILHWVLGFEDYGNDTHTCACNSNITESSTPPVELLCFVQLQHDVFVLHWFW